MSERTFPAAVPTAARVERFYAILCRFGADALLDTVTQSNELRVGVPVTAAEQAGAVPASVEHVSPGLDLGRVMREAAVQGGLAELAETVLDIEPGTGGDAPIAAIRDGLVPFAGESLALIGELMSFGAGSVSDR
jgi:hypothetical protein